MKNSIKLFTVLLFLSVTTFAQDFKTVEFKSEDGLKITADLYLKHKAESPFIVLFHQAGWSRGEYREIAPKLNKLGFNCMAVDQRSGEKVNNVKNETFIRAFEKNIGVTYPDAIPDLLSAIKFAKEKYAKGKLIIWGSSYSSALVLKLAGDDKNLADAVMAFAPGEYYTRFGKPNDWITKSAQNISVPVFITSAKKEKPNWWGIYNSIKFEDKHYYLPDTDGNHGSRALWEKFDDNRGYWKAVKKFLKKFGN